MSVKIIHTADLHLGRALPYLDARAASRRSEVALTLQKITDICKERSADALVIAGDLFESPNPQSDIAAQTFSILGNAGLPVIICAGNHDCLLCDSPYFSESLPKNIYLLTKETPVFKLGDKAYIYGESFYDYEKFSSAPPALPAADGIHIMVLHADIETESRYNPINADFLAQSGADYVALGHIHKRSELKRAGNTHYAYSGCPEGQGFDELWVCGVYCVTIDKNSVQAEFIPTSRRIHAFEKVDITACEDNLQVCTAIYEQLKAKYGENFGDNLYKIHLTGYKGFKPDINFITDNIASGVYYVKVADKAHAKVNLELLAKEPTLKGIFARRMAEKINACEDGERELLQQALQLGLAAFDGEVVFDED